MSIRAENQINLVRVDDGQLTDEQINKLNDAYDNSNSALTGIDTLTEDMGDLQDTFVNDERFNQIEDLQDKLSTLADNLLTNYETKTNIETLISELVKSKSENEDTSIDVSDNGILLSTVGSKGTFQILISGDGIFFGQQEGENNVCKENCIAYIDQNRLVIKETVSFDKSAVGVWLWEDLQDEELNQHLTLKYIG